MTGPALGMLLTSDMACLGNIGHDREGSAETSVIQKTSRPTDWPANRTERRDRHVMPQSPQREVPGAGSPLNRTVLTGPSRQALVLASFPTALYLLVGAHHEVLPVLASDALMLPTGIRLGTPSRDIVWGVGPGDRVSVGRSRIRLPGWQIRLVREWRPARVRAASRLAEPAVLSELADMVSRSASVPGLEDQASAVCRAAQLRDDVGVRRGVRQLVGAGQGLTPSGDDVLCAVLLVLSAMRSQMISSAQAGAGDVEPIALLGAAVQAQWSRTTSLSASLIDAARGGYAVPQLVALVDAALGGDLMGTRKALASTLAIGHWSGPDLVAGVAGCLRGLADARPNTAPAPFQSVKALETVPERCSDRYVTHPSPLKWGSP